ncbi:hypothetical protein A3860_11755 [Niastella vici]|uniref:Outer membrane protein beta-barrel domain-containing protein n=1 Tax=Niastella vici TaxID=1703345 RepID=A0A1V9FFU2_9BACT|nr:hypothetical protein [Niastella vici]OQP57225.1 hypothetical protein A3860_11755 [Niastella vici]
MKLYGLLTALLLLPAPALFAQHPIFPRVNRFADITGTGGSSQGTIAASYVHNWHIGKRRKWEAGAGLRWTAYFGTKTDFITAPARLARSNTTPFLIVFAGQKTSNWDTLTVQRPLINSLNFSLNFGYNFTPKWSAGFNIDLIGFSFGRRGSGILTSNGNTRNEPNAKPYGFNLLLTGDNDYGSLNSEYFIKYRINSHWGIKAVYEYYFAEYQTSSIKQTAPDGTMVDRFRNKVNTLGIGISYHFNN